MSSTTAALNIAVGGIKSAHQGLARSAHEIASANIGQSDPTQLVAPLVDLIRYEQSFKASAQVITRIDQAVGSLIDMLA